MRTCGIRTDRSSGHGLVEIGDDASTPSANFVPENSEATEPPQSYRTFCHYAPCFSELIGNGGHFYGVSTSGHSDNKSGMVNIAGLAPL